MYNNRVRHGHMYVPVSEALRRSRTKSMTNSLNVYHEKGNRLPCRIS